MRAPISATAAVRSSTRSKVESGGPDGLFIEAGRDEQEEAAGSADVEFTLGDLAGNHRDIGKHEASLVAKQASPFAQCSEAVPEVQDGVDAEHGVETPILEGQRPAAIDDRERRTVGKPARRSLDLCVRDGRLFAIDAGEPTSGPLDDGQRWASGTAADIEDVAGLAYLEKIGSFGVFSGSGPTLLPNVVAEDFTPQRDRGVAAECGVLHGIEVGECFALIDHRTTHFCSPALRRPSTTRSKSAGSL